MLKVVLRLGLMVFDLLLEVLVLQEQGELLEVYQGYLIVEEEVVLVSLASLHFVIYLDFVLDYLQEIYSLEHLISFSNHYLFLLFELCIG